MSVFIGHGVCVSAELGFSLDASLSLPLFPLCTQEQVVEIAYKTMGKQLAGMIELIGLQVDGDRSSRVRSG